MRSEELKSLVDKYWMAETTVEEERSLKAYFKANPVSEEYKEVAALMGYYNTFSEVKHTQPLNDPQNVKMESKAKQTKVLTMTYYIPRVAAIFIILAGGLWAYQNYTDKLMEGPQQMATIIHVDDPDEALMYTEEALAIMARVFNKGTTKVETSMGVINNMPVIGNNN